MSLSREKFHSRSSSFQNRDSIVRNTNEYVSKPLNYNQMINQSLINLLEKLIELTEVFMKNDERPPRNSQGRQLINLASKKNSIKDFTPPSPPLPYKSPQRSNTKIGVLKNDFESLRQKLMEYDVRESERKFIDESPIRKSLQRQETQSQLQQIQEAWGSQIQSIKERMKGLEEDMGEIILLYKQGIFC